MEHGRALPAADRGLPHHCNPALWMRSTWPNNTPLRYNPEGAREGHVVHTSIGPFPPTLDTISRLGGRRGGCSEVHGLG